MAVAEPGPGPGILVALDVLIVDDPDRPRAAADASVALERLGWIGRPVVLAGTGIARRRLPDDAESRVAWVRRALDAPQDLAVACFEEPDAGRAGGAAEAEALERWADLRRRWSADRLVTRRASSVGTARRAGLEVVRIGPRDTAPPAAIERPDREARDLLDAVSQLVTAAAFVWAPDRA